MSFCSKCGKEVTEEMNVCPYCGNPLKVMPTYKEASPQRVIVGTKNSGLAAVLSLILPGLGQMYAGQIGRGLLFLFIGIPLTAIIALFFFWLILPLFLPLAFWLWNIFDAYNLCNEYNRRLVQTGTPPWKIQTLWRAQGFFTCQSSWQSDSASLPRYVFYCKS